MTGRKNPRGLMERCIHCAEPVVRPFRALGDAPVCGLCVAKTLRTLMEIISCIQPQGNVGSGFDLRRTRKEEGEDASV